MYLNCLKNYSSEKMSCLMILFYAEKLFQHLNESITNKKPGKINWMDPLTDCSFEDTT